MEEWLVFFLKEHKMTITTAESCTGGMVASHIVSVSGSSEVFSEGYITYSEQSKNKLLGVSMDTIKKYNVVSREVAGEMAEGAARAAGTNVAVSTTGVAGPLGGSEEIPVGTVCIGCYINGKVYTEKFYFDGNRKKIRKAAAEQAIQYVCGLLKQ